MILNVRANRRQIHLRVDSERPQDTWVTDAGQLKNLRRLHRTARLALNIVHLASQDKLYSPSRDDNLAAFLSRHGMLPPFDCELDPAGDKSLAWGR